MGFILGKNARFIVVFSLTIMLKKIEYINIKKSILSNLFHSG